MQIKIFDKTSNIKNNAIYLAYEILKYFDHNNKEKETVYKLVRHLDWGKVYNSYKQFSYALIFLHSCDIIDFEVPYISLKVKK